MSGTRPSIFEEDDLDLGSFAPKVEAVKPPVRAETVREVAEQSGFHSRSPRKAEKRVEPPASISRPSLKKSGRTVLLNARITQHAHDRFHAIVEAERLRYERGEIMHRPTLGEIVERALGALEREGEGRAPKSSK
jgi:hypothetical protein